MTDNEANSFVDSAVLRGRALLLGARLDLRRVAVLSCYGVAVLFGVAPEAERALRVEWYIVALIAFDIVLVLYGMWRG